MDIFNDISGNQNHWVGNWVWAGRILTYKTATFNWSSNYIEMTSSVSASQPLSASIWMNTDDNSANMLIFWENSNSSVDWRINKTAAWVIETYVPTAALTWPTAIVWKWYHLVLTYWGTASPSKLYVDWKLYATSANVTVGTSVATISVGSRSWTRDWYYSWKLADAMLFENRELTATDVQQLYYSQYKQEK